MGRKRKLELSVQEFQAELEKYVKKGFLPLPVIYDWQARLTFEAYKKVENKQAKMALLHQLSYVLVQLRLRNPKKRFEKIIEKTGIDKTFAYELLYAYSKPKEWKS
jgi:hypothetical protein